MRRPYLEIDRVPGGEPCGRLADGVGGMTVKDVKVSDSLFIEERTGHSAMESMLLSQHAGIRQHWSLVKIAYFHISPASATVGSVPEDPRNQLTYHLS